MGILTSQNTCGKIGILIYVHTYIHSKIFKTYTPWKSVLRKSTLSYLSLFLCVTYISIEYLYRNTKF